MTKTQATAQYAAVYSAFLATITVGGSKEVALAYAVQDMLNQVKGLTDKNAALYIADEADYLQSKMARAA